MKTTVTRASGVQHASRPVVLCLALLISAAAQAASDGITIELGQSLLEENCGRCHATGLSGDSPFKLAPPFRALEERYPIENLEEALAEGIVSGHPAMPEFIFEPDQIGAIIAYLKSLHQ